MDISVYVLVFLIMMLSSFIHSSAAFGFSVFSMTLMPLFVSMITSAALGKIALLILCSMMAINLRKHINYRFIIMPVIFQVIGNTLGFYLLMTVQADVLKKVLGCILVCLGIFMFFTKGKLKMKKSLAAGMGLGLLAGIVGGMFNLAGVVLVIYFYSALEDKLEYAASLQATFVVASIYGIVLNIIWGNYTAPGVSIMAAVTIAASILGCYLGLKVLKKINKQMIGNLSYIYMIVMGVAMAINLQGYIA